MRALALGLFVAVVAGCAPDPVYALAVQRLPRRPHTERHIAQYIDSTTFPDADVYTFCRDEREPLFGDRHYSGACVVIVCPKGDDGTHCN